MNAVVCRLCGKSDKHLLDVFLGNDKNLTLKVYQCFGVWISKEDTITKSICRSCYFFTNSAYEHRIHSLGHDAKLKREDRSSRIKFPTEISQKDFLGGFELEDNANETELVETDTTIHPSARKLKRKYPNVLIPPSCMNVNLDPVVVILPSQAKKPKVDVLKWYYKKPDNKTIKSENSVTVTKVLPKFSKRKLKPKVSAEKEETQLDKTVSAEKEETQLVKKISAGKEETQLVKKISAGKEETQLVKKISAGKEETQLIKKVSAEKEETQLVKKVSTQKEQTQLDKIIKEVPKDKQSTTILKDRCVLKVLLERDHSLTQFLTTPCNGSRPDVRSYIYKVKNPQPDGLDLFTRGDEVATYICQTCNKIFDSKQLLCSHKKHHHKSSLRCGRCSKKFSVVEQLMLHMASHKPKSVIADQTSNNSNVVDALHAPNTSEVTKNTVNDDRIVKNSDGIKSSNVVKNTDIVKNSDIVKSSEIVMSSDIVKNSDIVKSSEIVKSFDSVKNSDIVKSSQIVKSFDVIKNSDIVKSVVEAASPDLITTINSNINKALGKTSLNLTEVNDASENHNYSTEENNVAASDAPDSTEVSNIVVNDVPPIQVMGNTEESNVAASDVPPIDVIDAGMISDSDSEDCTIVGVTPGPSKISIDNVLLFALTPQSKHKSLEEIATEEIAAAVETILPKEDTCTLQKESSSEEDKLQPDSPATLELITNISSTNKNCDSVLSQNYQVTQQSETKYKIIYQNTSEFVENIYLTQATSNHSDVLKQQLLNEEENNVQTTTCVTNPVATSIPLAAADVPEPCTKKVSHKKDGKTSIDPVYLQNQPSTSTPSSDVCVISDDDGSGDASKEQHEPFSEIFNKNNAVIIPASINHQTQNNAVMATNESKFINYILNKCSRSEKRPDPKTHKRFLRNIRMKGRKFIIPVQVTQSKTDFVKMLFKSNITTHTTTVDNSNLKTTNLWDPQTAICATQSQNDGVIQQTPNTSNVDPQPQLTINVYESPSKTTISSQKPLVINSMSYPTINMANKSPAIPQNTSLCNIQDNCQRSEYLMDTMQMPQAPPNLQFNNIINIDFQDNVDIPVHIIHKDIVSDPAVSTNSILTNGTNTVEQTPLGQTNQHRPMIRLKHISELMG